MGAFSRFQKHGARGKFLSQKTIVDGLKFDSQREAEVYLRLKLQLAAREFKSLERQVTYVLKVRGIVIARYRADFVVHHWDGTFTVIDVKSVFTRKMGEYRMKRALMEACFGIVIQEIT